MYCSSFKFILVLNSVLFWNLLVFDILLGISETVFCSISALQVKVALLLDAFQLLMLFVGAPTYLEPKLFLLIIFCNGTFLIRVYWIINCIQVECVCFFFILLQHMLARLHYFVISFLMIRVSLLFVCLCLCMFVLFLPFAYAYFVAFRLLSKRVNK
jgi:hypothetical protein